MNPVQTVKLYETAVSFAGLTGREVVFDLFCGIGTISHFLAEKAKEVYGVEIVPQAIEDAKANAVRNGVDNVKFFAAAAEDVAERGYFDRENPLVRPDVIVLDPPRKGCEGSLLKTIRKLGPDRVVYVSCDSATQTIRKLGPDRVVYVSCDSATLARDLKILCMKSEDGSQEASYEIRRVRPCDMFPHSTHVETVVQLSKGNISSQNVKVEFSLEDMDMSRFQQGATYEQIQAWVQEKYGFHVTHLNIAKTKRKCGIIERQNYNLPKSEDSRSPETPKEKEEAIIDAFLHFKMM